MKYAIIDGVKRTPEKGLKGQCQLCEAATRKPSNLTQQDYSIQTVSRYLYAVEIST
jgi:hypothetical protein